uniref:Ig-like domain-containing protein n=1 Tax=Bubo bubo TaxID=30461 RepID=A0A8C0I8N8_BUBBB
GFVCICSLLYEDMNFSSSVCLKLHTDFEKYEVFFFFPDMLSNPKLIPVRGTLNVVMNQNVSLSCHLDSGSPPIRYTLFKHSQKVTTLIRPDLTPGLFNLTINSASDMGEYKCKAENNSTGGGKYSNSLNFTLKEPISRPVLSSPTSQAKKGQNVTLSCLSENGSLPITYIFFKGRQSISTPVKMQKREAAVIFLFINSSSDFGIYKCRAENSFHNNTKYSNSFNFTLAGIHSQALIISLGLILLLFVIGFALAIRFFIIPSYKASELFECLVSFSRDAHLCCQYSVWNIMLQVELRSWYFRMLSSLLLISINNKTLTRQNL